MRNSAANSLTFPSYLKLGLVILAVGYIPIQLYILFGPRDGNPIGLGLMFVVCLFAGLGVIVFGAIRELWHTFNDRR